MCNCPLYISKITHSRKSFQRVFRWIFKQPMPRQTAVKMSIEIKTGQKTVEYPAECYVALLCGPPKVPTCTRRTAFL